MGVLDIGISEEEPHPNPPLAKGRGQEEELSVTNLLLSDWNGSVKTQTAGDRWTNAVRRTPP
ncbi:hypothetical protein NG799_00485 [Laspinema sp. D1]|uniref:Uncharacterized protein n=1 Tax=Laspinema palackyanum D2a TaxID=2953684 RepID=A0ABT2MJ91_9CYAN|nr:hypothetical protein [Laspinema sp. D2a]